MRRKDVGRYKRRTALIRELKSKPCTDCGVVYPYYVMEFDHVRGEKLDGLNGLRVASIKRILAEVAKCDVVCSNCHKEREYRRLKDKLS